MKRLLLSFITITYLFPVGVLAGEVTTRLRIEGMNCALCAPAVTKALKQVEGVRTVDVSVTEKRAVVVTDETVATATLTAAVAKAGFSATVVKEN
jgi:copper chaperone CopZ